MDGREVMTAVGALALAAIGSAASGDRVAKGELRLAPCLTLPGDGDKAMAESAMQCKAFTA